VLAWSFLAGSFVGATLLLSLLLLVHAILTPVPSSMRLYGFTALGTAMVLSRLLLGRCPLPSGKWQIPAAWLLGRRPSDAALFGGILGTAVLTYIPSCSAYLLAAAICLLEIPINHLAATAIGFAVGRSSEILLRSWHVLRSGSSLSDEEELGGPRRAVEFVIVGTTFAVTTLFGLGL
jgi:hypothetical protein